MLGALLYEPDLLESKALPIAPSDQPRAESVLAFLVGGTWVVEAASANGPVVIEERFDWGLDRHFIFSQVVARLNEQVMEEARGCLGWYVGEQLLRHWSFTTKGVVNYGEQVHDPGQKGAVFDLKTEGSKSLKRRIAMIKVGRNELQVAQAVQVKGIYGAPRTVTYHRRSSS